MHTINDKSNREDYINSLPDDCIWVLPLATPAIEHLIRINNKIEDIIESSDDIQSLHHYSGEDDGLKGMFGEYHYENYYDFPEKEVNPTPGDGGIDYTAIDVPSGRKATISVNTRARRNADLMVREWRMKCDFYFLYETNLQENPDIPLVGLVGFATHDEVEEAPLFTRAKKRKGQFPHLVKRENLHTPPKPDGLIPA